MPGMKTSLWLGISRRTCSTVSGSLDEPMIRSEKRSSWSSSIPTKARSALRIEAKTSISDYYSADLDFS